MLERSKRQVQPVTPCSSVGQLGRPPVFVIVLNWNGWRDTVECLESLFRLDYPDYRIVVVDNGSEDGSVEHICAWADGTEPMETKLPEPLQGLVHSPVAKPLTWSVLDAVTVSVFAEQTERGGQPEPALTVIQTGTNLGYAGGNNVGIRYALAQGAQYVWILNNDTVVDSHAVSAVMERVGQDARIGLCGGVILGYYDPVHVQVAGGAHFDDIRGRQEHIGNGRRLDELPEPAAVEASLSYVAGSAVLATRRFLEDVGLMDERYFLYYEELDWAIRGASKGYSLGYAPNAIVYHKEGGSIGSTARNPIPSPLAEYYLTRNLLLIARKYYPKSTSRVWSQLILRLAKRILTWKWANARALVLALVRPALGSHLEAVRNVLESNRVSAGSSAVHLDRPRILYVMHVDWDSPWQRPHELAKQLAKEYNVQVAFAYGRYRSNMRHSDRSGLMVRSFLQLPLRRQSGLIAAVNRALLRPVFGAMVRGSCADVIWLTHPEQVEYIPTNYQGKLVYDCMDDSLAFPQPAVFTERMRRDEAALVGRSDLVLTSSASLETTLRTRYGASTHTRLVRNGCAGDRAVTPFPMSRGADGLWHIGYIGVASTLDFQALGALLSARNDIFLDMYGPVDCDIEGEQSAEHICWHGPVAHEDIPTCLGPCCCLIAPYRLNDRVMAADSVKLYDYVSLGKPIVARRYPEIIRFSEFVEFYETPQELVAVVSRMCSEGFVRKYTEEQRMAFLSENTWDVRGLQIRRELKDLLSRAKG